MINLEKYKKLLFRYWDKRHFEGNFDEIIRMFNLSYDYDFDQLYLILLEYFGSYSNGVFNYSKVEQIIDKINNDKELSKIDIPRFDCRFKITSFKSKKNKPEYQLIFDVDIEGSYNGTDIKYTKMSVNKTKIKNNLKYYILDLLFNEIELKTGFECLDVKLNYL